ncbi:hypothetical protein D918_09733 [Trichuris suis]|nr:hypothetical protein D918_09733 [Trichuris suis]
METFGSDDQCTFAHDLLKPGRFYSLSFPVNTCLYYHIRHLRKMYFVGQITHGSKTPSTSEHSEKNYDGLFKFTVNLLQKMHRLRRRLNEIHYACSNRNIELLQTQSSLLLAHAQIERQKGELRELNSKAKSLKRAQTYHGQDLLQKKVNADLSFYLPFKLYGSQLTKVERCPSEFSIHIPDETLETEFISFIEPTKRKFLPEPKPRAVPSSENVKPALTGAASLTASIRDTRGIASDVPKLSPTTSAVSHRRPKDRDDASTADKGLFQPAGVKPIGKGRSPSLQRLTKVGHVKALAATFDANEAPRMQGKSDSTSALPHYSYGLFYCPEQQMPKTASSAERQCDSAMTTKGKGSQSKPLYVGSGKAKTESKRPSSDQFDSSAESYRETEYETMVYQMSMRPVPVSVVPPSQRGRAVQQPPTRIRPTAIQRKTAAEKSQPTSGATPIRPVVCVAKPSCIPQRTVTAMARKSAQKEQSARASGLKTPKILDNQQGKGESGAQQTRTSWLQKLRRRV